VSQDYDVVIVGAGPAGLSAALVLGRCCRRVLLCDDDHPRNSVSRTVHGFLTRDGIAPQELRRLAREQLERYDTVEQRSCEVTDAAPRQGGFLVSFQDGSLAATRKLLLASGLVDLLPAIPGLRELWGRGVYPCPYCDGWEVRGRRLGVYGRGEEGLALCRAVTGWSADVRLFSDGPCELSADARASLAAHDVPIHEQPLLALEERDQTLGRVVLAAGDPVECDALFMATPQVQQSRLAETLGCTINRRGCVETGGYESTEVPGLYAAGDAANEIQLAIVAAAAGARAAFDINRALVRDAFEQRRP
jgi:thioredoxin reductase